MLACEDTGCTDIVARTTTNDNGSYTLNIPAGTSPRALVVKVQHADGAKMVCDVSGGCGSTAFGDDIDMDQNLNLRSTAVVDPTATRVDSHITPLTELATVAAIKSRGEGRALNAEAISQGEKAVRTLFGLGEGLQLSKVAPVDITKADAKGSDEQLSISLLSAGFATGNDATTRITDLAAAVAGTSGTISATLLTEINTAAKDAASSTTATTIKDNAALTTKLTESLTTAKTSLGCADDTTTATCTVTVEETTATSDELAALGNNSKAARALVADMRTLGVEVTKQFHDYDPETDTTGLFAQTEAISEVFGSDMEVAAEGMASILEAVATKIDGWYQGSNETSWTFTAADDGFDGTLSRAGERWTLTEATYTSKENTSKNMKLSLDVTTPTVVGQSNITVSIQKLEASSGAVALKINENSRLNIVTNGAVTQAEWGPDGNFTDDRYVETLTLDAGASITHGTGADQLAFTGQLKFEAGTTEAQRSFNQGAESIADAILPKMMQLDGKFTGKDGLHLTAKATATLDNYSSYRYYLEDDSPENLVKESLDTTNDKLVLTLGDETDYAKLSLQLVKHDNITNQISYQCEAQGQGRCGDLGRIGGWHDGEGFKIRLNDHYNTESILAALQSHYGIRDRLFGLVELNHPEYGELQISVNAFDPTTGGSKSIIESAITDVNKDNRYAKFSVTVETSAKIAATLPEMDIKLQGQRTGFEAGNGQLELGWTATGGTRKFLRLNVTTEGDEATSVLTVTDSAGTTMRLTQGSEADRGNNLVGRIIKDGTTYAEIKDESDILVVYHLFNEDGTKATEETGVEITTLF